MHSLLKPANVITERFSKLFSAHDVQPIQIPRLIPAIKYESLNNSKALLAALTPEVIDATAKLFGIRPEWLEGLDDMPYQVAWLRGKNLLTRLSDAITLRGKDKNHFPLRVLTTSMNLDRQGHHQQWLLPVIVETVYELGDTAIHRCHIFGNPYDWTDEAARLKLKAITWVVRDQLKTIVPLFQVTPTEMEQFKIGHAIPSVLWRQGLVSEPSLEDYVLSEQESVQAKETDELTKLLAYLDASGLKEWQFEAPQPLLNKIDAPEPAPSEEIENAAPPTPEKPAPGTRMTSGKRQTQKAIWDAIVSAAKTLWAKPPYITIAEMIRRLKSMPHLKAGGLSDSAIHKHLRPHAPPEVRGKSGRKPK